MGPEGIPRAEGLEGPFVVCCLLLWDLEFGIWCFLVFMIVGDELKPTFSLCPFPFALFLISGYILSTISMPSSSIPLSSTLPTL